MSALQDRLAYGPNFDTALAALFGETPSTLNVAIESAPASTGVRAAPTPQPPAPAGDANALIEQAARDLADYQRLTAEGRLGEAGAKLEAVKRALDQLARQRR